MRGHDEDAVVRVTAVDGPVEGTLVAAAREEALLVSGRARVGIRVRVRVRVRVGARVRIRFRARVRVRLGLGHRLAHGAAARANDAGVPAQPGLEQAGVLGCSQLEQLVEDRVDAGRLRLAARAARLG